MRTFSQILLIGLLLISCNLGKKNTQSTSIIDDTAIVKNHPSFPKAVSWVNDFDDILSETEEHELDSICKNYQQLTTNQLVIASIDSIEPYTSIESYSTELFNDWELGTKEKNNGLLITVFKRMRKTRITTGLGTEKILTNEICSRIIEDTKIPNFKEGKYFAGLKAAILEIIKIWK